MATINELARWLLSRDDIAVIPHVSPDGDALGSGLAIARALSLLNKRARVVCVDDVPAMYRFLPGAASVAKPEDLDFQPKCLLFEDVAALDRAGDGCLLSARVREQALIDHHETNAGFCPLSVVNGKAAATGEMVVALLDEMGVPLDTALATCLYTAIATDTGNFSFANTTPGALRGVARLIEAGLHISEVNRALFRQRSLARTRLLGAALSAIEMAAGGRVAMVRVTRGMFERCGAAHPDTECIVNYLDEIEGVRAAILAEEKDAHVTKFSLRSGGAVDVSEIARSFGGGGHQGAAGMTLELPIDDAAPIALRAVLSALDLAP